MKNIVQEWLQVRPAGLYCVPGDFHIDPVRKVDRAVITHGHSDHARPGHAHVLATAETHAVNRIRLGKRAGRHLQTMAYDEVLTLGGLKVWLVPAGHILGSAQVVMEYQGARAIVSGDYKRGPDPTCVPFDAVRCDVFVTEATFGRPVYRHPDPLREASRLRRSLELFPDQCHLVNAYGLGKSQRMIGLLRQVGWTEPVFVHGAMVDICHAYKHFGVDLGDVRPLSEASPDDLTGQVVLAPPGATQGLTDQIVREARTAFASGWMRLRKRATTAGVDLPLIISDHADWPELTRTLVDTAAEEVWITHGEETDLINYCKAQGIRGRKLSDLAIDKVRKAG